MIVVDEIGNAHEVAAIKDIAQPGVMVLATAHGTTLQRLLENPMLNSLVGGKQKMVIGDLAARYTEVSLQADANMPATDHRPHCCAFCFAATVPVTYLETKTPSTAAVDPLVVLWFQLLRAVQGL